jgi:hypothetical protein
MGKYTGKKAVVTGGTFERPDAAGEHLIQDRGAGADEAWSAGGGSVAQI